MLDKNNIQPMTNIVSVSISSASILFLGMLQDSCLMPDKACKGSESEYVGAAVSLKQMLLAQ